MVEASDLSLDILQTFAVTAIWTCSLATLLPILQTRRLRALETHLPFSELSTYLLLLFLLLYLLHRPLSGQHAHKSICDHLPLDGLSQTPPRLVALPPKPCSSLAGRSCCWLRSWPSPTRPRPPELELVLACTCHTWAWGSTVFGNRYKRGAFFLGVLGVGGCMTHAPRWVKCCRRHREWGEQNSWPRRDLSCCGQAGFMPGRDSGVAHCQAVIGGRAQMPFRRDGSAKTFVPLAVP